MANDTNWEALLDWSKIDLVWGIGFYSFIKGSAKKAIEPPILPGTPSIL